MKKVMFNGNDKDTIEKLEELVASKELIKGAYTSVMFKSQKKALAAYEKANGETIVEKISQGVVRFNIDYNNLASVKEKRLNADPSETKQGRAYGELVEGYENLLISHNEAHLIKVYTAKNATNGRLKSKWFVNGEEVTDMAELEKIVGKSQIGGKGGDIPMITIHARNLISIGR